MIEMLTSTKHSHPNREKHWKSCFNKTKDLFNFVMYLEMKVNVLA